MKKWMMILFAAALLAACTPAAAAPAQVESNLPAAVESAESQVSTPIPAIEAALTTDFDDAANLRSQLAYGTLLLVETDQAVNKEQAETLLLLWQAVRSLTGDAQSVSEEINAVQNQIVESMTEQQLEKIASFRITNAMLSGFYAELGVVLPTPAADVTRVPGQGKNVPPEVREATRTAAQASGASGSGMGQQTKTLLFDQVIEYLEGVAGGN